MPIYDFECSSCNHIFEEFVRRGEATACPRCGYSTPKKLISKPAAPARSGEVVSALRRQANREGLFSNYSRAERSKIPR